MTNQSKSVPREEKDQIKWALPPEAYSSAELASNQRVYLEPQARIKKQSDVMFRPLINRDQKRLLSRPFKYVPSDRKREVEELAFASRLSPYSRYEYLAARYGLPFRCETLLPYRLDKFPVTVSHKVRIVDHLRAFKIELRKLERTGPRELEYADKVVRQRKVRLPLLGMPDKQVIAEHDELLAAHKQGEEIPSKLSSLWKKSIDSELYYMPLQGHTHGIKNHRDVPLAELFHHKTGLHKLLNILDVLFSIRFRDADISGIEDVSLHQLQEIPWVVQKSFQIDNPTSALALTGGHLLDGRTIHEFFEYGASVPEKYSENFCYDLFKSDEQRLFALLAKYAVILGHIVPYMQYHGTRISFDFYSEREQVQRRFRCVNWLNVFRFATGMCDPRDEKKQPKEGTRPYYSLSNAELQQSSFMVQHWVAFSTFHPFFTPADHFVRQPEARVRYTTQEIKDCCSFFDISTRNYARQKTTLRKKRVFDKEARRFKNIEVPVPQRYPNRGYFVGRSASTFTEEWNWYFPQAWFMRTFYLPNLKHRLNEEAWVDMPHAPSDASSVAPRASTRASAVPREVMAAFRALVDENKQYVGSYGGAAEDFRTWLYDDEGANKLEPMSVSVPEFMSLEWDEQEDLFKRYLGARATRDLNKKMEVRYVPKEVLEERPRLEGDALRDWWELQCMIYTNLIGRHPNAREEFDAWILRNSIDKAELSTKASTYDVSAVFERYAVYHKAQSKN